MLAYSCENQSPTRKSVQMPSVEVITIPVSPEQLTHILRMMVEAMKAGLPCPVCIIR